MLIDCDKCEVRGSACAGCVVSVLLGAPPSGVELDDSEQAALAVLADAGMVPRLRLVTRDHPNHPNDPNHPDRPDHPDHPDHPRAA